MRRRFSVLPEIKTESGFRVKRGLFQTLGRGLAAFTLKLEWTAFVPRIHPKFNHLPICTGTPGRAVVGHPIASKHWKNRVGGFQCLENS
ncbi:hypothetical protein P4C99_17720 [Pontiellaceae bacterium B1224]|nr:hypothetical protein [Pontiellaceae bacterium B1224]